LSIISVVPILLLIQETVGILLFHVREQVHYRGDARRVGEADGSGADRHTLPSVMVILHGQPDLLEIVDALGAAGSFARRLHGREQQTNQHADDGDHYQKLD
jgi:hypothetical protein